MSGLGTARDHDVRPRGCITASGSTHNRSNILSHTWGTCWTWHRSVCAFAPNNLSGACLCQSPDRSPHALKRQAYRSNALSVSGARASITVCDSKRTQAGSERIQVVSPLRSVAQPHMRRLWQWQFCSGIRVLPASKQAATWQQKFEPV